MSHPVTAYVGVGSNLDDPAERVRRAFNALAALPTTRVTALSSLYLNPPMGPSDQPHFVNAVAALETGLAARDLLHRLHLAEADQGRRRSGRWGPRTLDLDLLLYGDEISDDPALRLPHPDIARRAFVLVPLMEIAPELEIPGAGPVATLRDALEPAFIRAMERIVS